MSSIVIAGDTSGSITIQAPAVAGTTVLNLPSGNADIITSANVNSYAGFAAGTRIGFQQTSAPTGWTKDTTAGLNDSIMRIVTGAASSGGSNAFSTFNGQTAVGATTLSETQIPSHTHSGIYSSTALGSYGVMPQYQSYGTANVAGSTTATGGGGSHNHSITTGIKYYDFIIAAKD